MAPLAGTLLGEVVHDDLHHGLVDLAVDELHDWLVEHPDTFAEVLVQRAPWWTPDRAQLRGHPPGAHRAGAPGWPRSGPTRATAPGRPSTRC